MTNEELQELKRLYESATPGPWHWEADSVKGDPTGRIRYQVTAIGKTVTKVYYSSFEGGPTNAEDDAKFIAASRAAVPALIAEVESLRNQLDKQQILHDEYIRVAGDELSDLRSSRDADIERAVRLAIMKESLLNPIPNVKERLIAEILAQLKAKNNG